MYVDPEKQLEEFLAALHPTHRKWLEKGINTLTKDEELEATKALNFEAPDFRMEYARLLQPFPAKLREYRKRFEHERAQFIGELLPLPAIPEGRPRKDALAHEAAKLKEARLSYAKIAQRLNRKHGQGTATRESIRKLLKRLESLQSTTPRTKPKG